MSKQSSLKKHIIYKSPGDGILPYDKDKIIGKRIIRMIPKDTTIKLEDVE